MSDCPHPNFDDGGVCTLCKEFYSAEHDEHSDDIHPTLKRLVERCVKRAADQPTEPKS